MTKTESDSTDMQLTDLLIISNSGPLNLILMESNLVQLSNELANAASRSGWDTTSITQLELYFVHWQVIFPTPTFFPLFVLYSIYI